MELADFGFKIGAAVIAGLLIGLEREFQKKHAGLKTNALVSLGAAVFVLASLHFEGEEYTDLTRVMGQVVTGIGFLGAGVILHKGATIEGLTTAATVWCSAAAGCLAAIGAYWELLILTVLIVFINVFFGFVDDYINKKIDQKENSDR
ncbi:MAG TPA: MgtC/SapB family protein [Salinimicrobium sp.]|nr:MgtC/SapB family protein [Salinimicrobium sp.]